jgi:putative membrane protein
MNTKSMRKGFLFCTVAISLAVPRLFAQSPPGGGPAMPEQGKMSGDPNVQHSFQDQAFVKMVLERDMAEIELGKLAQQKAQNEDVKALGGQIVESRIKLDDGFKAIARTLSVSLPKDTSKKDKQAMAKLQGLTGQQFDDGYVKLLLNLEHRDSKDFQVEAGQAEDPNVKQAAAQDTVEINQRLKDTQKVAQAHNIPLDGKS